MKQTEKKCQNDIIKYYKEKGYQILKTMGGFQGSYSTPEGGPDLIIFGHQYFNWGIETFFIEVKSETGKLRDSQIVKMYELKMCGYDCFIARPCKEKPYFKLESIKITIQEYDQAKANLEKAKAEKKTIREGIKNHYTKIKGDNKEYPCGFFGKERCNNLATRMEIAGATLLCEQHIKVVGKHFANITIENDTLEGEHKHGLTGGIPIIEKEGSEE